MFVKENPDRKKTTFRKQIFCVFSSRPTESKQFYEPIVDGIFKLFKYSYLATMDYFVLKENILLWCSQPSILPKTNITRQILLFDGLASKHDSVQIVLKAITISLNEKNIFYVVTGLENIIQCVLSVKYPVYITINIFILILLTVMLENMIPRRLSSKQLPNAYAKCIFLFRRPAWKCFVVDIISHKRTANIFVWQSGLKTLFHEDYWLQQYILVVQVSYIRVKIFFVSLLGLKTFCSFYYQVNKDLISSKQTFPIFRFNLRHK